MLRKIACKVCSSAEYCGAQFLKTAHIESTYFFQMQSQPVRVRTDRSGVRALCINSGMYMVYNCMMWRQLWVLVQHTIYGLSDHNATVLCCLMACWDWQDTVGGIDAHMHHQVSGPTTHYAVCSYCHDVRTFSLVQFAKLNRNESKCKRHNVHTMIATIEWSYSYSKKINYVNFYSYR